MDELYIAMERALARVKFTGLGTGADDEDAVSEPERSGGEEEEEERETRKLVAQQNRKGRKSGGFQSMGERVRRQGGPVGASATGGRSMPERRRRLSPGLFAATQV